MEDSIQFWPGWKHGELGLFKHEDNFLEECPQQLVSICRSRVVGKSIDGHCNTSMEDGEKVLKDEEEHVSHSMPQGEAQPTNAQSMSLAFIFEMYHLKQDEGDLPFEGETSKFFVGSLQTSLSLFQFAICFRMSII